MKGGSSKADSKKGESRLSVRKKPTKKEKAAKDPNKPKRAPSAFFVFMCEDFRKEYKEKHPNNKSVAAVGKAGGAEWKSMSEEEKAPFNATAAKRKKEQEIKLEAYNKKLAGGDDDEDESDKSKSEVHDEDEDGSGEEDEDDD